MLEKVFIFLNLFYIMEKLIRKISERNLKLAVSGELLMMFITGAIFSLNLVIYGYYIFILATLIVVNFIYYSILRWYNNKKLGFGNILFAFNGMLLLMLFLGIQSPQVPFKSYILIVGFLLTMPAFFNMIKK